MNYIGNCTNDSAWGLIFSDASEMACVIEDSVKLTKKKMVAKLGVDSPILVKCKSFGFHETRGIAWAYDADNDIHYFWN